MNGPVGELEPSDDGMDPAPSMAAPGAEATLGPADEEHHGTRTLGAGAIIGRYMVLDRLGAGGMGVVYAAYDPELDRKVALKLLRPGAGGGKQHARLLREAQALGKLAHPNVVAIHDVGTLGEASTSRPSSTSSARAGALDRRAPAPPRP